MQVKLTSRQYEILDYGTVFLFDENADLTLNIIADNSFEFILSISFINDIFREQSLDTEISENCIKLTCINFFTEGTGLTAPMELAVVNGNTPRQRVKDRFTCYEIMHGLILIIGVLHACCHLNENMRKKF